jgi:hypothetical protein
VIAIDPAMSTVVGTENSVSCAMPSETVHRSRSATRNSSANRYSFQAIMKTYRAVAATPGTARGSTTRRMRASRPHPSIIAASSTEDGTAIM